MEKLFKAIPKLDKIILKSVLLTRWISLLIDLFLPMFILVIITPRFVSFNSGAPIFLMIWIIIGFYDLKCLITSILNVLHYKKTYDNYILPLYRNERKKLLIEVIRTGTPLLYVQDINFKKPHFKDYVGLALGISNKEKYWWLIFIPMFSSFNLIFYWSKYNWIPRSKKYMNEKYGVVAYKNFSLPQEMKELLDSIIDGNNWLRS